MDRNMFFFENQHTYSWSPSLLIIMFRLSRILCAWLAAATTAASVTEELCGDKEREDYPVLCRMIQRVADEPERVARDLFHFSREVGLLIEPIEGVGEDLSAGVVAERFLRTEESGSMPVVLAHGMGDSCFNSGMQSLTKYASQLLGDVYGTCIPTGDSQHEDTINGYFKSMDYNVDVFAAKVFADANLADGFYAIGLSQGNNVIRGYITKYNNPPVKRFISINGVNAGVGAVPNCIPKDETQALSSASRSICDLLMEQASKHAYSEFYQEHSFQAGYWRDPRPVEKTAYQTYSQLAAWNNEGLQVNETLKENWKKTDKFVWVMAEKDTMVWPPEGEHWGAPDPKDPFNNILKMKDTEWFKKDLFGLKTAEEAGKNFYESFPGDHLQFSDDDFKQWVNSYLKN